MDKRASRQHGRAAEIKTELVQQAEFYRKGGRSKHTMAEIAEHEKRRERVRKLFEEPEQTRECGIADSFNVHEHILLIEFANFNAGMPCGKPAVAFCVTHSCVRKPVQNERKPILYLTRVKRVLRLVLQFAPCKWQPRLSRHRC